MATHYIHKYQSDAQFAGISPELPNAFPIGYTADGGLRLGQQFDRSGALAPQSLGNGANFMRIDTVQETGVSDSRLLYIRQRYGIAGANGETLRVFSNVSDVAASTVRGAHISLSFDTSGSVTGLGVAQELTLHIPSGGGLSGTVAPLKVAINSDGAASDPAGSALSYIQFANQGDTTGDDDVDDDADLFDLSGFTAGAAHTFQSGNTAPATVSGSLRIDVNGTKHYLILYSGHVTTM